MALLYHSLGHYLKQRFAQPVRKLTLNLGFSCPNRDTQGRGGCTFCHLDSFVDPSAQQQSLSQQLAARKAEIKQQVSCYLAYFQAYSNTQAEISALKTLYDAALADPQVVGLCIGTRPDLVPNEVLALLASYQQQGKEVWLELGLQSAQDATLKRINRGHDYACFADAMRRAHDHGLKVCCHLILGLPGEQPEHCLDSHQQVLETGVAGLKLHPLHVVQGSAMARTWRAGRLELWTEQQYAQCAALIVSRTPAEVVFHRLQAHARPPSLLAPDWCANRWRLQSLVEQELAHLGGQGRATARPFVVAADKVVQPSLA